MANPPNRVRRNTRSSTGGHGGSRDEPSEPSVPDGGTYFLGRYRVVDEIGIGGMASVHLARMDGPGGFQKWVAIKRIHRHLIEDDQFIKMFLDEARIAARISHPNVAQVFDLGKHKDTYWIAMEYLHGEPLRELIRCIDDDGAPPISYHLSAKIVADAAEGLHSAHELTDKDGKPLNLVHRDVTPHNLFLTYDGSVKVVDFGIAKVAGRLSNTRAGMLKGKIAYMSPEQVRGLAVDRRTDVFALGVVLWELTTNQRLFRKDTDLETLERVQACVVPLPSALREDYPASLESIVMKALAKDPAKRYPTAREVSRALQKYLMEAGQFVGPEEIGVYVKETLKDRFEKREAHLQWAAEVTQTINVTDVTEAVGAPEVIEEVSALTYSSDVKPVPVRRPSGPTPSQSQARPAGPRPPMASKTPSGAGSHAAKDFPPAPRPAAGLPATRDPRAKVAPPLPAYEITSSTSNTESAEILEVSAEPALPSFRLGQPPPPTRPASTLPAPTPAPASSPHASQRVPPAPDSLGFHDYGDEEDDNAVTRIHLPPSEEHEQATGQSITTVPAKSARLEPVPEQKVVIAPSAAADVQPPSYAAAVQSSGGVAPPPMSEPVIQSAPEAVPMSGYPQHYPANASGGYPVADRPPERDMRTVLIALIAAATTLIALGLSALVVLKITEKPETPPTPTASLPAAPTGAAPVASPAPAPAPATPDPKATRPGVDPATLPEQGVDPSEIPAEKKREEPAPAAGGPPAPVAAPVPRPVSGGGPVAPPVPVAASGGNGFLTIVCDPFCSSVTAGGRNLGPSPVVRRPLPAGSHSVTLRTQDGVTKSLSVTITSDKTTARRVKMQ